MSFYAYLMNLRDSKDESIKDLAYEVELDRNFPRGSTNRNQLRAYVLQTRGREMVKTFDEIWKKFQQKGRW